jgi:Tol biopolymer transport system component
MIDQAIGRYRVLQKIGEGGMGVVYHARDADLERDVALKVLRRELSSDAQLMQRFKREARVLASLNHSNIAAIYGIEECDGCSAIVLEMVTGPTLSDRIAGRAMPLSEALPVAKQIAEALEYAHEHGIIHRDLKPSNIKITPEGTAKLLDFGLAKTFAAHGHQGTTSTSSTLTPSTEAGVVVGTAGYMSPEQARGTRVDKQTDIWAFGVVLFEMLTGRRAFARTTTSDTIVAILEHQPDWGAIPRNTPPGIRKLLARCLEKDPRQRLRDIGDANLEIAEALEPSQEKEAETAASSRFAFLKRRVSLVLLVVAVALFAAYLLWFRPARFGTRVHLAIPLPAGQQLTGPPAISTDGRLIAWTSRTATGRASLYIRALSEPAARVVSGSEDAYLPFFSPDGEWVAFFANGRLIKAPVSGGSTTSIADAPDPWGGSWGKDGSIIFVPTFNAGLVRVSANGGNSEALTKPDGDAGGYAHMYPQFLSDGRHVLFSVWSPVVDRAGTAMLSLTDLHWQLVLGAWSDVSYPVGNFLVTGGRGAGVRLAPLDLNAAVASGGGQSVLDQPIAFLADHARSWFTVSESGTLVYAPADFTKSALVWVDRDGRVEPVTGEQHDYWQPALSPEGDRAVVRIGSDLWLYDLRRSTRNRLTFSGYNNYPLWTRDGTSIVYSSNRGGDLDLYVQAAASETPPKRLLQKGSNQLPCSALPNGTVAFVDIQAKTGRDLWTVTPDGKATPFLVTPFSETFCRFSPDGRFVAYASDESGRREVYVQPYPGPGEKVAISTNGGNYPVWSSSGRELFFRQGDAMMVVSLKTDAALEATRERQLFTTNDLGFRGEFDVSADGRRFLMVHREPGSWPSQLDVVLNWFDDLRRAKTIN